MNTYVVQRLVEGSGDGARWEDITRVSVPPRTKRKTILEKAHEQVALAEEEGEVVRVLDEESASAFPVAVVAGPPRLVIG